MHLLKDRRGLTMVELLASLALLTMLMLCVLTLIVPFGKTFTRLRWLQSRQSVADTLAEKTAGQLRGATAIADPAHGQTVVFTDADGYIVVITSAGQTGAVPPKKAEEAHHPEGTPYAFAAGRACQLYCNSAGDEGYVYDPAAAAGFDGWFGENFYQDCALKFDFSLRGSVPGTADCVLLTVTLTGADGREFTAQSVVDLGNVPPVVTMTTRAG